MAQKDPSASLRLPSLQSTASRYAEEAREGSAAALSEIDAILKRAPHDRTSAIEELSVKLHYDFLDEENRRQFGVLYAVKQHAKSLASKLNNQGRDSLRVTCKKAPFELQESIDRLTADYEVISPRRNALLHKLAPLRAVLESDAIDEQQLRRALVSAKLIRGKKETYEDNVSSLEKRIEAQSAELRAIVDELARVDSTIGKGAPRAFAPRGKKENYENLTVEGDSLRNKIGRLENSLFETKAAQKHAKRILADFLAQDEAQEEVHLSALLDIGSKLFTEDLKEVANASVDHIEQIDVVLSGFRGELEGISSDTELQMSLYAQVQWKLQFFEEAIDSAQKVNARQYDAFEMRHRVKKRGSKKETLDVKQIRLLSMEFISDLGSLKASLHKLSGCYALHQTALRQIREDVDSAIESADFQHIQLLATITTSGQRMLIHARSLTQFVNRMLVDAIFDKEEAVLLAGLTKGLKQRLNSHMSRSSRLVDFRKRVEALLELVESPKEGIDQLADEQRAFAQRIIEAVTELDRNSARIATYANKLSPATDSDTTNSEERKANSEQAN